MGHLRINLAFNPEDPAHKRAYDLIVAHGRGNQSAYVIDVINEYLVLKDFDRFLPLEDSIRRVLREELASITFERSPDAQLTDEHTNDHSTGQTGSDDSVTEGDLAALQAIGALGEW